jgi:hypothetical protein
MIRAAIICFFITSSAVAQSSYLGRKNAFELTGLLNCPMLSGEFKVKNFHSNGKKMVARRDLLDYGGMINYNRIVSSKVSLGLSFGYRRFEIYTDRIFQSFFSSQASGEFKLTTNYRVQSASVNSISLIPTVSFASAGSFSGSGIENRIGIGYSRLTFQNRGYAYSLNNFGENEDTWTQPDVYFLEANWPVIRAVTLHYGISLKVPINDWLQVKIGSMNYLNVHLKPTFDPETTEVGLFNFESLFYKLQRENTFIWSLETGLVFSF